MENTRTYRKCSACLYYKCFYTKACCSFYREKSGYCIQKQKIIESTNYCELFKHRKQKNNIVTLEFIERVISDLKELELIFLNYDY